MATGISVHAAGAWSEYPVPYAKVSGVWRPVRAIYTREAGSWTQTQGVLLTLVAGTSGAVVGFVSGSGFGYGGQAGSLNGFSSLWPLPGTSGDFVYALCNSASQTLLTISGSVALTQSSISYVIVNGTVFLGSAATFNGVSSYNWTWGASAGMTTGNTYNCAISGPAIGS